MKAQVAQTFQNLDLPDPPVGCTGWPWAESSNPMPDLMPDGSPWPKISVVTPSYNQGQFIEETIRSVLLQGYPNLEFIIIDGGSTDNTLKIIRKYDPWLAYWVSEPDQGQSHAINKGIKRATGEILLWLNSDDLVLPNAFFTVAKIFLENPETRMVIGQAHIINTQGETTGELRSRFSSWEEIATNPRNSLRQISTFFSRTLFDEEGFLDESLHIAMDTELLVRFTRVHKPVIIDDVLTAFRIQPESKTASQLIKGYLETDRVRTRFLKGKKLIAEYNRRSANNWLSLSEARACEPSVRVHCLMYALKRKPGVIFNYRFWASLRKLTVDIFRYSS